MNNFSVFLLIINIILSNGCASPDNMPLIFGQAQTVGIAIGGTAAEQGANFTLGFRDQNIAIVPVTAKQSNGNSTLIKGQANEKSGQDFQDAFSVLGQFELASDTTQAEVGLGKFFATGIAAHKLADGFKKKISTSTTPEETVNPSN